MFSHVYAAFAITPQLHRHGTVCELGSLLDHANTASWPHRKLPSPVLAHLPLCSVWLSWSCHSCIWHVAVCFRMSSSYKKATC